MNRLLVLETIRGIVEEHDDGFTDFIIAHWERRVRQSDNPQEVINSLREAVRVANEFWEWSATIPNIDRNLGWRRNAEYTYLMLRGSASRALGNAKQELITHYKEDLERQETAFKEWMKEQDAVRLLGETIFTQRKLS